MDPDFILELGVLKQPLCATDISAAAHTAHRQGKAFARLETPEGAELYITAQPPTVEAPIVVQTPGDSGPCPVHLNPATHPIVWMNFPVPAPIAPVHPKINAPHPQPRAFALKKGFQHWAS